MLHPLNVLYFLHAMMKVDGNFYVSLIDVNIVLVQDHIELKVLLVFRAHPIEILWYRRSSNNDDLQQ